MCKKEFSLSLTCQTYCSEECRENYRQQCAEKNKPPPVELVLTCNTCGVTFVTKRATSFCSEACRRVDRNKRKIEARTKDKIETIVKCLVCGVDFIKHGGKKFCSDKCRNKANKQKNKFPTLADVLAPTEDEIKNMGMTPSKSGTRVCLRCNNAFYSNDLIKNRLCPRCNGIRIGLIRSGSQFLDIPIEGIE